MRSLGSNVSTTVRTVYDCDVTKKGNIVAVRIKASGFLYNMARAMAGTLVYAGLRKLAPGDISAILQSGDRRLAGPTLEAGGPMHDRRLVLEEAYEVFSQEKIFRRHE